MDSHQQPHDSHVRSNVPQGGASGKRGWVLGISIGIGLGAIVVCCGGVLFIMNFGLNIMANEVRDALAGTPEIQEHIGIIESFETNLARSAASADGDTFVYDIQGSKGSGTVIVVQHTDSNGDEVVDEAELILSDGRKIPIDVAR